MQTASVVLSIYLLAVAASPRDLIEVGWEELFAADSGWKAEPWLVKTPDDGGRFRPGAGGGAFEVPTAGRQAAWTRTTNPVWTGSFPALEVRYRLEPASAAASLILSDDSTGPITPGALNPENPLAREGQIAIELPASSTAVNVDLRERFKSDRVARITFKVTAPADIPAKLVVQRLTFRAAGGSASSRPSTQPASLLTPDGTAAKPLAGWTNIALPGDAPISASMLNEALGTTTPWPGGEIRVSGIPFRLAPPEHAAIATGVQQLGRASVDVHAQGSELALLLGTRLFGTDSPWAGRPRTQVTSPHQLKIELEYADGARSSCFPVSLAAAGQPGVARATQRYLTGEDPALSVAREPAAYVVPLEPGKKLVRISCVDGMTYGQVFLLAASVHESGTPLLAHRSAKPRAQSEAIGRGSKSEEGKPSVAREGGLLTMQNSRLRLVLDERHGLAIKSLYSFSLGRELVLAKSSLPIIEVPGAALTLRKGTVVKAPAADSERAEVDFEWAVSRPATQPADPTAIDAVLKLRVLITPDGQVRLTPALVNKAAAEATLGIVCPQLAGVRVAGDRDDCWYVLGAHSTLVDNRSYKLEKTYGGEFPLQFADLFAPRAGGGVALIVPDTSLAEKTCRFQQTAEAAKLSVLHPRVRVSANGEVKLPDVVLALHEGDWHEPFELYRRHVRAAARPGGRMADVFYCRRDYPLGGTSYLFDAAHRRYTPERLIEEADAGFGGLDMIDISGWAYHEAVGRVGEYRTNDLGGLGELHRGIADAHARHAKVGLYFEGYLVDKRTPIARRALPAWQLVTRTGQLRWWPGDMELFVCPAVEEWQRELSRAVADVAAESGADAVYLDEFGFCGPDKACWSREHGHPVPSNPMLGETAMLQAVRRELDGRGLQRVGIYIEQVPCDAMMPLIDGALNYGMSEGGLQHPTRLPLHRFVYPELSSMEMVSQGIRPLPVGEDDLQRCIFQGSAMWLKGRAASWYSPGFLETARRARPIFEKYARVFASPDCTPLVPTLAGGIYANRFATADAIIVTVYNAGYLDYEGDLLRTPAPADWEVRDLWNNRPATARADGDAAVISGQVGPRSAGVFVIQK